MNNYIKNKSAILDVLVIFISTSISFLAFYVVYANNLVLSYGDAESHLNISKRVVSSITPGLGQLGGNWLPLHHILMIPFVWNDYLWRTGIAGSIVSMFCFVLSCFYIFKFTQLIEVVDKHKNAKWIALATFATNPGILYMQSTPMGELTLIASLLGATFHFAKWTRNNSPWQLVTSGIYVFCGSLLRYDAWALAVFISLSIIIYGFIAKFKLRKIEGSFVLFCTVAFVGIAAWMLWNYLIFNEPLYFLLSPYSAKSQQLSFMGRGQLPSYKNLLSSLNFYTTASYLNGGIILFVLSLIGLLALTVQVFRKRVGRGLYLSYLLLLAPFPFYVITLYFGISIILIPQLIPKTWDFNLFNIRYGLMMIPAISVFVGLLAAHSKKYFIYIFMIIIMIQTGLFIREGGPIALKDATEGLSQRRPSVINKYVAKNYDYGYIMFDDFSRAANPVDLGIPMSKIIYVGNHPYWDVSLKNPSKMIRWLVLRTEDTDTVWTSLRDNDDFRNNYMKVYRDKNTFVFKRI